MTGRIVFYVVAGWLMFAAAGAGRRLLPASPVWLGQAGLKTLMLAFSLAAMRLSGRPWADFGFRAPTGVWKRRSILPGLALGAAAVGDCNRC